MSKGETVQRISNGKAHIRSLKAKANWMSTQFLEMVGCRLQRNCKNCIARKKAYYMFSVYLICSHFSNVGMFLAVLAKIVFWVHLGEKAFYIFFLVCFLHPQKTRGMFLARG